MQLPGKDTANALLNSGRGVVDAGLRTVGAVERVALRAVGAAADVVVPVVIAEVLERVDLTRLVQDNVDLDAIAANLDVDAVIARVDLLGLATYVVDGIDLTEIIRESTQGVTSDAVRGVRMQAIDADQAVARIVDRLLLRHGRREVSADAVTGTVAPVPP